MSVDKTRVSQQATAHVSVRPQVGHGALELRGADVPRFRGVAQWALEGPGWALLRPGADLLLLYAAALAAIGGPGGALHVSAGSAPLLATPPLAVVLFYARDLYRNRLRTLVLDDLLPVVGAVSVAAMTVAVLGRFVNGEVPSQPSWLKAWLFSVVAVCGGRAVISFTKRRARKSQLIGKRVLILGAGVIGSQIARRLEANPEYGLVPIGFLDEDPQSVALVGGRNMPVLGTIDDLDTTVERTGARDVIVAFSSATDSRVSRLIQHCQEIGVDVSVVPRMFDTINDRVAYDSVGGLPLLCFDAVDPRGFQFAVKHAMDRVLALMMLIVLSPVILGAALAVRLSSPGPVLFNQRRVGRDGKVFNLLKLRSMRIDENQDGERSDITGLDFLLQGDTAPGGVEGADRRTAVGRLLRTTSLDELPQLLNVLRGDMSLVGPRPERPEFVELFRQDINRYSDRHRVKSGITGWAQVHGLRGQTSLAERVEWDNYYIAHWSLGLDLKILLMTFTALFHDAE